MEQPGWTYLGAMKEGDASHPSYFFKSGNLPDVAVRVKKIEGGAGMSISTTKPPASEELTHQADDKEIGDAQSAASKILRDLVGVAKPSVDEQQKEEKRAADAYTAKRAAEDDYRTKKPSIRPFGKLRGQESSDGSGESASTPAAPAGGLARL